MYTSISKKAINHRDIVPFDTRLRDVIRGFAIDSRHFYFLISNRKIIGLISIANLNCRSVKVYLFSLLAELETQMGYFILQKVSESDLLQMTFGSNTKPKYEDVKKRYEEDKSNGLEVPFVEYLYLSDLINIIAIRKLFSYLRFPSRKKFEDSFNSLISLRNTVAHPSRSLITDQMSCKKLWEQIDTIEGALFIFNQSQV
jgi:hypothetical protein